MLNSFFWLGCYSPKSITPAFMQRLKLGIFVGAPGFEPGTSCSQSKRASRTALRPDGLNYLSSRYKLCEYNAEDENPSSDNTAHNTAPINGRALRLLTDEPASLCSGCPSPHGFANVSTNTYADTLPGSHSDSHDHATGLPHKSGARTGDQPPCQRPSTVFPYLFASLL